ncbi:MAG: hypothetical protein ACE5GJ_11185 [Gemmatimonadota bacterium]
MRKHIRGLLTGVLVAGVTLSGVPADAHAIPAFARKYRVTCALCHQPMPRLTAFGQQFAGNGFQMARGEAPRDTLNVGDPLLRLQRDLPLAIRVDAYLSSLSESGDGIVATDLQTPWGIKLLSGGQISDDVSYYLYFFLTERGEVAGLEDAYLQFNDVLGTGVDVIAGQFQVSDPMFKRELRLEYEDYNLYRVRVGDVRADVTYDRGLMALYSPWEGGDVVVELVNGQGLSQANEERLYDTDSWKNMAFRFSQDVGFVRLGAFAYTGLERSSGLESDILIWGPDVTLGLGSKAEVNAQFLRRTDDNPFFLDRCPAGEARCDASTGDTQTTVDAFMTELILSPRGATGSWFFTGLYNRIRSDRPVFTVRQGEPGLLDEYQTVGVGAHYVKARNLRLMGEATWDFERERWRFTAGVVTAF